MINNLALTVETRYIKFKTRSGTSVHTTFIYLKALHTRSNRGSKVMTSVITLLILMDLLMQDTQKVKSEVMLCQVLLIINSTAVDLGQNQGKVNHCRIIAFCLNWHLAIKLFWECMCNNLATYFGNSGLGKYHIIHGLGLAKILCKACWVTLGRIPKSGTFCLACFEKFRKSAQIFRKLK